MYEVETTHMGAKPDGELPAQNDVALNDLKEELSRSTVSL